MDRGNTILAYLTLAFVVFITMRGELPTYMGFLIPAKGGATGASGTIPVTLPNLG